MSVSSTSPHLRHGDQCREDQVDGNTSGINKEITVSGQKLETITSFKYPVSVVADEGSKHEILSRITQTDSRIDKVENSLD